MNSCKYTTLSSSLVSLLVHRATMKRETEAICCLVRSTREEAKKEIEKDAMVKVDLAEYGSNGEPMVLDKPEAGEEESKVEGMSARNDPEPMEDCHTATEASPPQEPNTHSNSPSNDVPSPDQPIVEQQPNETQLRGKGEENETIGRAQGSGIFLRPVALPQRIMATRPNSNPPKPDMALSSVNNALPTTPLVTTQQLATSSVTSRLIIRPPPPPSPSPSPRASPSTGKSLLQLPRFSLPLPQSRTGSSLQKPTPSMTLDRRENIAIQSESESKSSTSQTITHSAASISSSKTSGESARSSKGRFQLLKPQKLTHQAPTGLKSPLPPPPAPTKDPSSPPTPMFSLSRVQPSTTSITCVKTGDTTETPSTKASEHIHNKQQVPVKNKHSVIIPPLPPTVDSSNNENLSSVSAESIPQAKPGASNQEPQNLYDILQQQTSTLAPSIPCQPSETHHNIEQMELGGEGGGGGQEIEEMNTSFNLTGTSLDFNNQLSDFESGQLQMFSLQPDNTFNLSQSESFFNTNQPPQMDGSYGFMSKGDPTLSGGNYQDFFNQLNTTGRSSDTGGGFIF